MRKSTEVWVIASLLIIWVVVVSIYFTPQSQQRSFGVALGEPVYRTVRAASSTCGGVTLIDATNTARTSFTASVSSGSTVTLCKNGGAMCSIGGGIILSASSTPTLFVQTDAYVGTYSCVAAASSDISWTVSP